MIEAKIIEIRDRATYIPALAVRLVAVPGKDDPAWQREQYHLRRSGWTDTYFVLLSRLSAPQDGCAFPIEWGRSARTMPVAHEWIQDNWIHIRSGDVVDVRVILGEAETSAASEFETAPLEEPDP